MSFSNQLATQLRQVYFGGNWTGVNLRDTVKDITWEQALQKVGELNTVAVLCNHLHYYIKGVSDAMETGKLTIKDKLSFDHPPITSQNDWNEILKTMWEEAEIFIGQIEQIPEEKLSAIFIKEEYGSYARNMMGIVEHCHYHLGQIALIKKLIAAGSRIHQSDK